MTRHRKAPQVFDVGTLACMSSAHTAPPGSLLQRASPNPSLNGAVARHHATTQLALENGGLCPVVLISLSHPIAFASLAPSHRHLAPIQLPPAGPLLIPPPQSSPHGCRQRPAQPHPGSVPPHAQEGGRA